MEPLKILVKQLRLQMLTHEEAMTQIVEFIFWNARPTDPEPFKDEFRQMEAEGLLERGFYEEVLKRWKTRNRAWV